MSLNILFPVDLISQREALAVYVAVIRKSSPGIRGIILPTREVQRLQSYEVSIEMEYLKLATKLQENQIRESLALLENRGLLKMMEVAGGLVARTMPIEKNEFIANQHVLSADGTGVLNYDDFAVEYQRIYEETARPKSLENVRRAMNEFRKFVSENIPISVLNAGMLEDYKRARKRNGRSEATINMDIRVLKAAMNYAVKKGWLPLNPFSVVRSYRKPSSHRGPFSDKELATLLEAIREEWLQNIVQVAVLTGMRRGELVHMRWEGITAEKTFYMVAEDEDFIPKGGKERKVPLNSETIAIIENQPRRTEWIFTDERGDRLRDERVGKRFKHYVTQLNPNDERDFHCLRHSCATRLREAGTPLDVVAAIIGHSSEATTQKYLGMDPDRLLKAASSLAIP